MSLRVAALLVSVIGLTTAMAETPADRWNLSELYPSDAAWSADASKLDAQMKELAACKGHLGDNAARFKKCLDLQADMGKRYARMNLYSSEQLAGDTGAAAFLELSQKAEVLGAKLNEASSFMNPEILRLGKNKIARFVAQDASLKIYRHPLDEILRLARHTLDSEGESLVAQFGLMSGAGGSAYSILTNADIPWPTIKLSTGEEVRLDASAYTKYREAPNRDDRRRVMDAFFGTFKTYERTLGVTLYSQLKEAAVFAKVRKYPDSITSALDANRVPVAVFDMLIKQTNANLATLHR
jgi:oligoendopeptidase F